MPAALVTGSSRGIGRAIALRFAADGYDVAVNYHTSDGAAERVADAVRDRGGEAVVVGADVSDADAAARFVDAAVDAFGGVDHVVNNAGIDQHVYTENLDPADFDRVMDVNVNSAFTVTKGGLISLPRSHARDFAPDVRVNAIAPGHVETDMTDDRTPEEKREELAAIPADRFGQPADIADAAAYLRDATFVTGETLNVNGGERMG